MKDNNIITLAHGNGGIQMQELLKRLVWPRLENEELLRQEDAAVLSCTGQTEAVFTTDAFTVQPLFFPGGDIGHLSVCGTVNDLAMMGAEPAALSLALIIEAGLAIDTLERVIDSIRHTADEAGVAVVTGDTKVVGTGQADKLFITTSGLGWRTGAAPTGVQTVKAGDAVIVSGTIGHHGVAILAARASLPFVSELRSDAAPLNHVVKDLVSTFPDIRWLRDPTRGGTAAALNELAEVSGLAIEIDGNAIPVSDDVRGAAEILGLDPLYLANEGRFITICPESRAEDVVALLRSHPVSGTAVRIGTVGDTVSAGRVVMKMGYGGTRIIDMPSGEQLPRIC
jgi:hydrogenase expression/formation protein HypE